MHRCVFKIGQVWRRKTTKETYCIVAIDNVGLVKAKNITYNQIVNFIHVGKDKTAEIDTSHWTEVVPRECLCGTNRTVCTYHKLEPWQSIDRN